MDTGYYETFNQPNVHLMDCVTDPIVAITKRGVRTQSGETALDMPILATGYDGLTGFDVVGRNRRTVNEKWKAGAVVSGPDDGGISESLHDYRTQRSRGAR